MEKWRDYGIGVHGSSSFEARCIYHMVKEYRASHALGKKMLLGRELSDDSALREG